MSNRTPQSRVAIFHNIVPPYRLPLFEELANQFDLTVYFGKRNDGRRRWSSSIDTYNFEGIILDYVNILGIIVNYLLPVRLLQREYDCYIVGENGRQTLWSVLVMWIISMYYGKPFLIWSEAIENNLNQERYILNIKRYIAEKYSIFLYQQADGFIALSKKSKRYLRNRGVETNDIFTGPQVMPSSMIGGVDCPDSQDHEGLTLLTMAYLSKLKGIEFLIEALQAIPDQNVKLVIAGAGPNEERLRTLAQDDNRIRFTGFVSSKKKWCTFESADIFILPTLKDAWGLVVNEALYFGLPVIVTDAAGCADYLVDGNGFVVKPGSVSELVKAIRTLLHNSALRKRMGERSRAIAEQLTVEEGIRPFVEAIDHVVQK